MISSVKLFVNLMFLASLSKWILGQEIAKENLSSAVALKQEPIFLPKALKPFEYIVKIDTVSNRTDKVFLGYVEIYMKVLAPTNQIAIHVIGLTAEWQEAKVLQYGDFHSPKPIKIVNFSWSPVNQMMTYDLDQDLIVNQTVSFSINYSAYFVNQQPGFNQIDYTDKDGINKTIYATYFQTIGARYVFPCLDEPHLKARFTIHVSKKKNETVRSNMESDKNTSIGSLEWVRFQKSLPMSTYLVSIVIFDFKAIPRNVGVGKFIRVWTDDTKLSSSNYIANLSTRVLKWYENYLQSSYPLRKLDIATIPSYIVAGMENFGLIFMRASSVSFTDLTSTKRYFVAYATAHEICHQWSGNLVTPKWWNDIWLSEGFATFFSALALDEIDTSLEAVNQLVVNNIQTSRHQQNGALTTSLVLHNFEPINGSIRNSVIYYKGAGVLRMMKEFLGDKPFQRGIQNYFKKRRFQSVTQNDFFDDVMESHPNWNATLPASLHEILDAWTNQKNVPLVTVRRNKNGTFSVTQEPYSGITDSPEVTTRWWIPLSYYTSNNSSSMETKPKLWMSPSATSAVVLNETSYDDLWIVLNTKQVVNMFVNYDKSIWETLIKVLKEDHHVIHVLNRAQLVDDSFKMFLYGRLSVNISMDLTTYLRKEKSYYPIKRFLANVEIIERILRHLEQYSLFKDYLSSILTPVAAEIDDDNLMSRLFLNILLPWQCLVREPNCVQFAVEQFKTWKKTFNDGVFSHKKIDNFLCVAIEEGTDDDWNFLYNFAMTTYRSTTLVTYLRALTCTTSESQILWYLEALTQPNNTVSNVNDIIISDLISTSRWKNVTWNYVTQNYFKFQRFPDFVLPNPRTKLDLEKVTFIYQEHAAKNQTHLDWINDPIMKEIVMQNERRTSQIINWLEDNTQTSRGSNRNFIVFPNVQH